MILAILCILLCLLFLFPFAAGMREIWKKEDAEPLYINMDYSRDPRFFAVSFRKILLASLGGDHCSKGLHRLMLSKEEMVEVVDRTSAAFGNVLKHILYVKHNLVSEEKVIFEKEVYVGEDVNIGAENQLRALTCDGNVHLSRGVNLSRWLDAEGSIRAEEQCNLGISTTCAGELSLASKCHFKRLYGFPVVTDMTAVPAREEDVPDGKNIAIREAAAAAEKTVQEPVAWQTAVFEGEAIERDLSDIPANSQKNCTIITANSLTIGDDTVIRGHVKTHGELVAGACVTITGNLFAEGDIHLGPHSRVLGTVFTQGRIVLEEGVTIGSSGRVKTIIGKKGIVLQRGVRVYGYIMTEGEGTVA